MRFIFLSLFFTFKETRGSLVSLFVLRNYLLEYLIFLVSLFWSCLASGEQLGWRKILKLIQSSW